MWLYLPHTSTSSASALEAEDSISESGWQCQALAACVVWRGKHSPSATWSARCKKVSWLKPLFGAMLPPSMAARGVESWMASLAESRASRIPLPENDSGKTTSATSGATQGASSSSPARGLSSSKTSAGCSPPEGQNGSGETFAGWALKLREDCLRRQKSARAMNASASLSSQWRTPAANNGERGGSPPEERDGHNLNLQDQVLGFPGSMWGTPTTRDWKDTGNMENVPENGLLGRMVLNWSTPRARDGEKGGPNQSFGAGGVPLPAQAQQWATPSVADTTGGRMARSGDRSDEPLLKGQAANLMEQWPTPTINGNYNREGLSEKSGDGLSTTAVSFHQAHPIYPVGGIPSKERRSLNPLFVEWLMGWPPGWTLLAWTDFACSEMALLAWKARMRSALSQLGLPPPAPLVQHDLFAQWS